MLNAIETRAPPTIDHLATLSEQACIIAAGIAAEVAEIDRALTALDDLLNLLQHTLSKTYWVDGVGNVLALMFIALVALVDRKNCGLRKGSATDP